MTNKNIHTRVVLEEQNLKALILEFGYIYRLDQRDSDSLSNMSKETKEQ